MVFSSEHLDQRAISSTASGNDRAYQNPGANTLRRDQPPTRSAQLVAWKFSPLDLRQPPATNNHIHQCGLLHRLAPVFLLDHFEKRRAQRAFQPTGHQLEAPPLRSRDALLIRSQNAGSARDDVLINSSIILSNHVGL